MSKRAFVWKFNERMINFDSPFFASEWVCRRDDMRIKNPRVLPGKTIWLAMTGGGYSRLFGHLVAEKIERAKNGDGRYILTADARVSFRILPGDADEWREWILPRNDAAGISVAADSFVARIRKMLAENTPASFLRSRAAEKINVRAGGAEAEYLRVLGERFYGDLARGRDRETTPYAALFDSGARADKKLREADAQIRFILQNGFCRPLRTRAAPFVDAVLRPADESKMFARRFVAGGGREFSMDKTEKAEETHQQIARELCRFLRARNLPPLCSRSIDAAVRARGGLLIFEIKSANEKNFESQARGGMIQILEYKMAAELLEDNVFPALVISSISSPLREEYMRMLANSVGVAVVSHHPRRPLRERFSGLDEIFRGRRKKL